MSEVDKKAAQIDADLKAADRKRADEASDSSKVLAAIEALGKNFEALSARLDKIEKPKAAADALDEGLDDDDDDAPNKMKANGKKPGTAVALDDEAECAKAQVRADAVFQSHGQRAPAPISGESPLNYRRRLLMPHLRHSKEFGNANLRSVSGALLDGLETRVFADSIAASMRPEVPEGQLLAIDRVDQSGRTITEFHGNPGVWMRQFCSPAGRLTKINLKHD